ncbi:MAG: BNR-4 repeat-containing protein [Verrucomicrobiales bacterium]|nr:BNR-4 repeat-containing protein [Verrucomicrobiales bacterium]
MTVACWLCASICRGGWDAAPVVLNDDGGWSWFEDERAIVVDDKLFVGSVAMGREDKTRRGNIEVVSFDLKSGARARFPLRVGLEADDHDSPALLALPDRRLLAMYGKHGPENRIYWRISTRAADGRAWGPESVFVPSASSRVTYANLHWIAGEGAKGRIYNFFRGLDNSFKPSWMTSDDWGVSWRTGGLLIEVPSPVFKHRPYVKYVSDGRGTIHFGFTEGHPRDFDNSIYHARIRNGVLQRSDGAPIRALSEGPIRPGEATSVYTGGSNHVAWIHDIAADRGGRVRAVFSVQRDSAGLPPKQGGSDHRYFWAEWDGRGWSTTEIARAGQRLYAGEDDYTGGICLHPDEPGTVFISTSVDPATGAPLTSGHFEVFRGRRERGKSAWVWESLTPAATTDQLRPIVPRWRRGRTVLLWLRGTYRAYTDYDLEVVAKLE